MIKIDIRYIKFRIRNNLSYAVSLQKFIWKEYSSANHAETIG
jgi:hypothetical protein